MPRRLLVLLVALFALLLTAPVMASAATTEGYPAPPVSQSTSVSDSIQVLATSQTDPSSSSSAGVVVSSQTSVDGENLAWTGVGFNVTLVVLVGGLIVIFGALLVVFGARRGFKGSRHS